MNANELQAARLRAACEADGLECACARDINSPLDCTPRAALVAGDAILTAAGIPIDKLISGECVAVPVEPTEEMWGGFARDMMMWLSGSMGNIYPRTLFKHLELLGHEIPDWLRDEPEMKNLDHTPSKGTRCVILYKAMLAARPKEGK